MLDHLEVVAVSAPETEQPAIIPSREIVKTMAAENANAGLWAIHSDNVGDVEKTKVGSSAMDPSMQMSMVSQTLTISNFPQVVQGK